MPEANHSRRPIARRARFELAEDAALIYARGLKVVEATRVGKASAKKLKNMF